MTDKSDLTKNKIIKVTTELILQSGGNTSEVTIRKIAESAKIGTGLVNHYFGSKERLLEICVQQIISGVITAFRPITDAENPRYSITENAKRVMDFLMENSEISRISITSDMLSPAADDNTMKTVSGFAQGAGYELTTDKKLEIFMLTALMQSFFLRRDTLNECFGIDFQSKPQRDKLIEKIAERTITL